MLLFFIIWKNADQMHPISQEEITKKMLHMFEPECAMTFKAIYKLVGVNLKHLSDFFETLELSLNEETVLALKKVGVANESTGKGCRYLYYIEGKTFTETEIRYLCDSVLFSPGTDEKMAKRLIKKLKQCCSKHFGSCFEYVRFEKIIKRTKMNIYMHI